MTRRFTRDSGLAGLLCALCWVGVLVQPAAAAARIRIVAAENFYGDIAAQLAGASADVRSVLHNPDADPHLFEASVATAKAVASANLVIYNGLHYDSWMTRLLASTHTPGRLVVEAAAAAHAPAGANPHLWYDLAAMRAVARTIVQRLGVLDPTRRPHYAQRLGQFLQSLHAVQAEIERLRARFAGTAVAATEPVADYLAAALGLTVREQRFALAVMNNTEPSARDTATFEADLRQHRVRVLIYNKQALGPAIARLLRIARHAGIPVVGMTETEPPGLSYQQWMHGELSALERALAGTPS